MKVLAVASMEGGCDYTIGCGVSVDELEVESFTEEELLKAWTKTSHVEYGDFDEGNPFDFCGTPIKVVFYKITKCIKTDHCDEYQKILDAHEAVKEDMELRKQYLELKKRFEK